MDEFARFQVGDRVRYLPGTISAAARRGEIGTVAAIFSAEVAGAYRADVMFADGLERGVDTILLQLA
jgi:hypothetical protein